MFNCRNQLAMDPMTVLIIVLLPFTITSTFIYVYILSVILRNRDLRVKAFFMLNVAMGAADIGTIWSMYIFHRLRSFAHFTPFFLIFGNYGVLAFMCTNGFGFFHNTQKYLLLAIGVNRFMAVVMPSTHKKIWTKNYCALVIFLILGFNAVHSAVTQIVSPSSFQYKPNQTNLLTCRTEDKTLYSIGLQYNSYLPVLLAVLLCLIYGIIVIYLCTNRKKVESTSNASKLHAYKVELRLTICVLLHSLVLVIDGVSTAFSLVFEMDALVITLINNMVQDILCGCNPYLLLLFSSELRKLVFCSRSYVSAYSGSGSSPVFTAVGRVPARSN
uniref:G_PROTEIN_RECEP_F1_2 domain-containing protein n=1 Tax=Steinernema glaseri TaxID=37863 RepID=A0A1I7XZ29_9BILA